MMCKNSRLSKLFGIQILLLCTGLEQSACLEDKPPYIKGELDMIGVWMKTQNLKNIKAFLGIPYAKPPIENRRFADPEKYGKLNSTLFAKSDANFCAQKNFKNDTTMKISEDCLYLNVYTRNENASYPVIVFIHGGNFIMGGGQSTVFGPQYMLDNNLVLVTIQYRLGPFGFLRTKGSENDATGNYGLKDQVMALQWVQDNIKYFGGNPDLVTIFGQSAGAWSVSAHLASPMSKGLFHRAIAFSGSTTSSHFIDNVKWTEDLAKKFDCQKSDIVNCLRKIPWEKLADKADWKVAHHNIITYNIEVNDSGKNSYLTEHPSVSISKGNFNRVPLLLGTTRDEFDEIAHELMSLEDLLNKINGAFDQFAPLIFTYVNGTANSKKISKKIKEFYFEGKHISLDNLHRMSEAFSDSTIIHSVHRLMILAKNYVDVYHYRFDYKGRFSCGSKTSTGVPKFISHSDDLMYLFWTRSCAPILFNTTDPEQFMVERLNRWIYNFAKNGNPNEGQTKEPELSCAKWPASRNGTIRTMYNDVICTVDEEPYVERMKLWDSLFPLNSSGNRCTSFEYLISVLVITTLFVRNICDL